MTPGMLQPPWSTTSSNRRPTQWMLDVGHPIEKAQACELDIQLQHFLSTVLSLHTTAYRTSSASHDVIFVKLVP